MSGPGSRRSARRRPTTPWLVLGLLFAGSLTLTTVDVSRAQEAPIIDATVLVTGRVDLVTEGSSSVVVSAASITMQTGQATFPYTARGTVLLLVEAGQVRVETDAPLEGVRRQDDGEPGTTGVYNLSIGERVPLTPGSSIRLRNEETEPVRLFLLTVVPAGP